MPGCKGRQGSRQHFQAHLDVGPARRCQSVLEVALGVVGERVAQGEVAGKGWCTYPSSVSHPPTAPCMYLRIAVRGREVSGGGAVALSGRYSNSYLLARGQVVVDDQRAGVGGVDGGHHVVHLAWPNVGPCVWRVSPLHAAGHHLQTCGSHQLAQLAQRFPQTEHGTIAGVGPTLLQFGVNGHQDTLFLLYADEFGVVEPLGAFREDEVKVARLLEVRVPQARVSGCSGGGEKRVPRIGRVIIVVNIRVFVVVDWSEDGPSFSFR